MRQDIAGYLKLKRGESSPRRAVRETEICLTGWKGHVILDCRGLAVTRDLRAPDGPTYCCAFQLTHDRWIIGYALGNGMLFRGELRRGITDLPDAIRDAEGIAEYWEGIDYEDELEFIEQQLKEEEEREAREAAAELQSWEEMS